MKGRMKPLILALVMVTATGLAALLLHHLRPERQFLEPPGPTPVPVDVRGPVESADRAVGRWIFGNTRAERRATVSAEVAGRISRFDRRLDLGRPVADGALLVEIDPEGFQLEVDRWMSRVEEAARAVQAAESNARRARAILVNAREAYELAENLHRRTRDLLEDGTISRQDEENARNRKLQARQALDNATGESESAQASLELARARSRTAEVSLRLARKQLRDTKVRAPFSGVIVRRSAEVGDWVVPGQPLLVLADLSRVRIEVEIPSEDVRHLEASTAVCVLLPALGDDPLSGRLEFLSAAAELRDRTVQAHAVLPNPQGHIRAGLFARVWLPLGFERDAVLVPWDALRQGDEQEFFVFTVEEEPEDAPPVARRVAVRRGREIGEWVAVRGAFSGGAHLVVSNVDQLLDGSRLSLRSKRPAATAPESPCGPDAAAGTFQGNGR